MSRKAFANVEDAVNYLRGSDICETMTVVPPDIDELTDEDEVDEESLNAPIIWDIPGGIEMLISTKSSMNNKILQHRKGQEKLNQS